MAVAYVAALREAFLPELTVGEEVETPLGVGEVRYVSGDGGNAAVRVGGREVWLPVAVVARPDAEYPRAS